MITSKLKNFIGGEWLPPNSEEYGLSLNPANGTDRIAQYPLSSKEDVDQAVNAAREAYQHWRLTPAPRRGEILYRAAQLLLGRKDGLGRLVTREMGKVLAEGLADVQKAVDTAFYMAGEGRRLRGETVPSELPDKDCKTIRTPYGVFALITPWNFPLAVPAWKLFTALICGNTVVLKPSSDTPRCAAMLVEVLEQAGIPPGVVNLVMGEGPDIGEQLASHPEVDGVSFTGSCVTGEGLEQKLAPLHRHLAVEMGGKNAILVMDDADLDLALEGIIWSAFGTSGQRCTAASRVIVQEQVHDRLIEKVVERVRRLRVGDGLKSGTEVGPLVNEKGLSKVLNYIRIGQEEGAHLHCGGERIVEGGLEKGYFVEPTVFSNLLSTMRLANEEVFGPVIGVMKCADFEEGIALANSTRFGLASAIYTRDARLAALAEREFESGLVYINTATIGSEVQLPFGGFKHSGSGHPEGGGLMGALDFFSRVKTIYRDFSGQMQRPQIDIEGS